MYPRLLLLILILIGMDFFSKTWVLTHFIEGGTILQITDFFNIVLSWNRGISFGAFHGAPAFVTTLLEYGIPFVVIGLIIWCIKTPLMGLKLGLSFVIGGAIGNVIDRWRYGAVVDFLDFHWYDYHWYTFNLADAFVCIGAAIIMIDEYIHKKEQ